MPSGVEHTPTAWQHFLDVLSEFGIVRRACDESGIHRQTAYDRRDRDEEFRKAWDEAKKRGNEGLEDEAKRRAAEGYNKPITYKGDITGYYQEYSDSLMSLMIHGAMPEKYRHRSEFSGPDGGPIEITDNQLASKLVAILDAAHRRMIDGECEDLTGQALIEHDEDDGSDLL